MRIVKKINNNVALAQDASGEDVIVFGKGIGFPAVPYDLDDETRVERTFFDVDESVASAVQGVRDDVLLASSDIVDLARMELGKLNGNIVFTLADHLQFATERTTQDIQIDNPLSCEVAYVYPRETELGTKALGIFKSRTGVELPKSEACSIALHIVNAEADEGSTGDMHLVMESARIIEKVTTILEHELGLELDRSSYAYVRFVAHLRYLLGRLMNDEPMQTKNRSLFTQAAKDFPVAYRCAYAIEKHLEAEHGWHCSDEELLYLMMHVNRLAAASSPQP
ncbi:MAG: PRD domain-containing protein [Atopobiaceae bacterium]|jgi:beta-glucoside operon transcriptional antiterminator|nr:PRD domain-containing protein [Atopobiaceae bacterium]MCH4181281.1 PRD domain-containing protein [Atopobiaceae bacterium]MCH4213793.1 PRD domain-containing protein [Atopobiaceae bacterium]MCH4229788.1 PRD domain-containing protein [Atopobiaceae bacterium]MCH4275744.1 PRD domain-containing protein [Atopobiaceae bacterium]